MCDNPRIRELHAHNSRNSLDRIYWRDFGGITAGRRYLDIVHHIGHATFHSLASAAPDGSRPHAFSVLLNTCGVHQDCSVFAIGLSAWAVALWKTSSYHFRVGFATAMTNHGTLPSNSHLFRRFAIPAVVVWLIYLGIWYLLFAISQPILGLLLDLLNWYREHFMPSALSLETEGWAMHSLMSAFAEGAILIVLGLLLGLWPLYRKRQQQKAPAVTGACN